VSQGRPVPSPASSPAAGAPRLRAWLTGQWDDAERQAWQDALGAACPDIHWLPPHRGTDVVDVAVVANPPPGALRGLQGLRLIQSLWAGVDRLLDDPTLPEGVPLARMVDPAMTRAMVETATWATLGLHRGFFRYARQQAQARWLQLEQHRADEIGVLVLGMGEMGAAVARALAALGYRVSGWASRAPGQAVPGVQRIAGRGALAAALAQAQVVLNLLPLTPQTRGLVDATFLAALPPAASFVNLARGAHVVDADLLAALDAGHLAHAVLDVFHVEPLAPDHPFWRHPGVTVLPHVAALTDRRSAAAVVADNLARLARGEPVRHRVERSLGY
jgi:glyoxylate/hydroxypyruvate reductase A